MDLPLVELCEIAKRAAKKAGAYIRQEAKKTHVVEYKEGADSKASSVVTEVDKKSEEILHEGLYRSCNKYQLALLTEETPDDEERFDLDYFWCVDPLDGTLSFIEGEPGYSVSIGLVRKDGTPVIGVIYDPYEDVLYEAILNKGAKRNGQSWALKSMRYEVSMFADRSLKETKEFNSILAKVDEFSKELNHRGAKFRKSGGAALNACWMIENAPACYFKLRKQNQGGGSLWDFSASACIVKEAGAFVSNMQGTPLDLNNAHSTFMNHEGVVYATSAEIAQNIVSEFGEVIL